MHRSTHRPTVRTLAAMLTTAILSVSVTGCSTEAPIPEPDSLAAPGKGGDSEEDLNLAPGEQVLEGTLKAVHFKDMLPPGVHEEVADDVDNVSTFYAIELDPVKPVDGLVAGGIETTQSPLWAILGNDTSPQPLDWTKYVDKRIRIIARADQLRYGSDIATPPDAVNVENSDHEPEVLD